MLLYGLFNSLRDSLLAVAGIPFAIGGGLIALYLAGLDFSVSAAIGFISLFGVAVMDGILNITYFRELRTQGMDVAEAVFRGAEQRMRPMLMTALSAGVGLFPAAISHGIGSQVQRPLATVVVGGMFIGPLLLLSSRRRCGGSSWHATTSETRRRQRSARLPIPASRRDRAVLNDAAILADQSDVEVVGGRPRRIVRGVLAAAARLGHFGLRGRTEFFAGAGAARRHLFAGKTGVA